MKLKKRFNESLKSEIDIEYVKDCFIDTIDNGFKVRITRDLDDSVDYDFKTCILVYVNYLKCLMRRKSIENVIDRV
jgi:hypothetical protein